MNSIIKKPLTKVQIRVLQALSQPGTRIIPPKDRAGERTGYVTSNGSVSGWICPVTLKTFLFLEENDFILKKDGGFEISEKGKSIERIPIKHTSN